MYKVEHLVCGYEDKIVLNDLNFEILNNKITTIIGNNGSGKSTLLKALVGQLAIKQGNIYIDDKNIKDLNNLDLAKKVAYLAQSRNIPSISVYKMILHGRFSYLSYPRRYSDKDYEIVDNILDKLDLQEYKHVSLNKLSGGLRQKVYIGMALAQNADVIIMDEPTTFLDINQQNILLDLLKKLVNEGKTIILVMHDLLKTLKISDEIMVLDKGEIIFKGDKKDLLKKDIIKDIFKTEIGFLTINEQEIYYYL